MKHHDLTPWILPPILIFSICFNSGSHSSTSTKHSNIRGKEQKGECGTGTKCYWTNLLEIMIILQLPQYLLQKIEYDYKENKFTFSLDGRGY